MPGSFSLSFMKNHESSFRAKQSLKKLVEIRPFGFWQIIRRRAFGLTGLLLLISSLPLFAVTHDDSESLTPEFYITFRGTGTGIPTVTVSYDAYQVWNSTNSTWQQYTETITTNGVSGGTNWITPFSLFVNKGMPLDQVG